MKLETQLQLSKTTIEFYDVHACSFANTRADIWPGWNLMLNAIEPLPVNATIADFGCGEGRLLRALVDRGLKQFQYVGVDASAELLRIAQQRMPLDCDASWVLGSLQDELSSARRFDVVAMLGVLHHIPSSDQRFEVVARLRNKLVSGGRALLSFWKPADLASFANKSVDPLLMGDVGSDLDDNDYLMGWNSDTTSLRYCHHFDDSEIDALVAASGLRVDAQFAGSQADRTNRYFVLSNLD